MTNIIMVDDDPDDLFLTRTYFKKTGAEVNFTGLSSASELFLYIKNNGIGSIDVLLLDLNMPVMNGVEALKELRQYPHFSDLKVVIYSTSSRAEDRQICLDLGASDYLVKPATLSGMTEFVSKFLTSLSPQQPMSRTG